MSILKLNDHNAVREPIAIGLAVRVVNITVQPPGLHLSLHPMLANGHQIALRSRIGSIDQARSTPSCRLIHLNMTLGVLLVNAETATVCVVRAVITHLDQSSSIQPDREVFPRTALGCDDRVEIIATTIQDLRKNREDHEAVIRGMIIAIVVAVEITLAKTTTMKLTRHGDALEETVTE